MTNDTFEPPVAVAVYRLYLSFAPQVFSFPKLYRHSLGGAIERNFLVLLETIFEANAMPRPLREAPLLRAHAKCELLKLLVRMSFELGIVTDQRYFELAAGLREIGKMLGGWMKFVRNGPYAKSE
jgi:hypothetical protein